MSDFSDVPAVMTAAQAGGYLGVAHVQVLELIKQGRIPAFNCSKAKRPSWRIRRSDLDALFTVQTLEEK